MKFTANREAVEKLPVDWLGYIFYAPSKRFVGTDPERFLFDGEKPKVAVFVDENAFEIMALAKNFDFQMVQLHGKENPKTCLMLKNQGLKIIKAFSVDENFDFAQTKLIEEVIGTAETKITDYELEKVKNKVEADLLFNEIGYLEKAMQLASYEILGDAALINQQAELYRNISVDDILKVAQEIFRPGNRNTLNYFSNKKQLS